MDSQYTTFNKPFYCMPTAIFNALRYYNPSVTEDIYDDIVDMCKTGDTYKLFGQSKGGVAGTTFDREIACLNEIIMAQGFMCENLPQHPYLSEEHKNIDLLVEHLQSGGTAIVSGLFKNETKPWSQEMRDSYNEIIKSKIDTENHVHAVFCVGVEDDKLLVVGMDFGTKITKCSLSDVDRIRFYLLDRFYINMPGFGKVYSTKGWGEI